jgi:hypothetical protein
MLPVSNALFFVLSEGAGVHPLHCLPSSGSMTGRGVAANQRYGTIICDLERHKPSNHQVDPSKRRRGWPLRQAPPRLPDGDVGAVFEVLAAAEMSAR